MNRILLSQKLEAQMAALEEMHCNELLSDVDGFEARCTQPYGTEHSHHDRTALAAYRANLAEGVSCGGHDWDTASPGVEVCDRCKAVRYDADAEEQ